ncbi:alkB, alkylation repair homolog 2 (E. coli) [Seminavis robusta]|uniref:AlkB, alkylation repair homolog 2 (E. coli) n=1 Tax=Seminavis robusta TaxID=568900 RepID=A0A9N8HAN1_9STRA|nr:alkB, alkylation repair homolog 2 (E. coli) [Seminavis robusta]|eukprot:Sro326_g118020.1 alkB, alkylation repair homolog 2 (E. coli) (276) ;mRNA; f:17812-18639
MSSEQSANTETKTTEANPAANAIENPTEARLSASEVQATALGARLGSPPVFLTSDGASWYIHVKNWKPSTSTPIFQEQWDLHPNEFHALELFGKTVYQNRWSQSWGHSYAYSGTVSPARDFLDHPEGAMIQTLVDEVNMLVAGLFPSVEGVESEDFPYNGCLQNWYTPEMSIGSHADDEGSLKPGWPIFCLSWGGTRRFLFRAKGKRKDVREVILTDGDLVIMGGTCQSTHKHEVPKVRKTMDPKPIADRISWTVRAFRDETENETQTKNKRQRV